MTAAATTSRVWRGTRPIYGLGDLVARFLGVLLLPLYTAYLSPADYGQDRDTRRRVGRAARPPPPGRLGGLLPLLLRLPRPGATGRSSGRRSGSRWRRRPSRSCSASSFAEPLCAPPPARRRARSRSRGGRRALGAAQLHAAHGRLSGRGALARLLVATLATCLVTIAATVLLVVVLERGPLGALIGVFAGTLLVYCRPARPASGPTSASSSTGRCCVR